jgi:hypothetical protein
MFIEEQRVQPLPVGKRLAARRAPVRAGLNVPLVHEITGSFTRITRIGTNENSLNKNSC